MYSTKIPTAPPWTSLLLPRWFVTAGLSIIALCMSAFIPYSASAEDFALTVYSGHVTRDQILKAISPDAEFVDAYITGCALSWTFQRFLNGNLSLELEGQVNKYFGEQENWEFNIPIIVSRWSKFPWNNHLATSFAFGVGLSFATEKPQVEENINGATSKWMIYLLGELCFGPPKKDWAFVLRLHHRSAGYGLIAEEGGSNTLAAGLKVRF